MMKKVVLPGGTGFIGKYFEERFKEMGYKVFIISRSSGHIPWENEAAIIAALENAEYVINLAGKSVNCRYNKKNKVEIMQSRITTTNILGNCILACKSPPKVWMNSSTATIYRHAEDRPMTEENGEIGTGFSVDVATTWESEFFQFELPKTRQIALRTAIVLGKDGGVMTPYRNLVRFGLGGIQGSGKQKFSWIHVADLFQIVLFLNEHVELQGVFNCSSPNPISNREFMMALRDRMGVKIGLPTPKWMLETGAIMIRTETELVLKSRWVVPERLSKAGYHFMFETIEQALEDII
ncbi:TIGR01777 family oxidoreductase [Ornithinibacillus bavariensis]|uniref:TIGR01777 family oxidoreductase n=1 Tax=Ornithinibacillus bavariensis TaxID=545502 RepID=UPI000EE0603A|nr:TIGR01777 family protein [Ornithinibacillus sp.]